MDWRVLGKRDKLYVKQYEEETSLRCYLLLDKSASMGYRSDTVPLTKLEYASLPGGEPRLPDGLPARRGRADDLRQPSVRDRVPARQGTGHLQPSSSTSRRPKPGGETSLAANMHRLAESLKRRALVVVLSDLFDDPEPLVGATGGGKKAGAGRIGLQGGTPPDVAKDVGRLNEKQTGLRKKAEQVARKLEEKGYSTARLREAIELMKPIDAAGRDLKYDDLAKKPQGGPAEARGAFGDADLTAASISRARDLPPEMRRELPQGHDEGYPAGYESLLKNYYKKLSGEK